MDESNAKSLAAQTADKLTDYIISNKLESGHQLPNEKQLMDMLNVGRGTLREAVRSLVARNILVTRRGAGTFVANRCGVADDPLGLSFAKDKLKTAQDLVQVRLMIEPNTAALAAQRATPGEIEALRVICNAIEEQIKKGENHSALDQEFHAKIAQYSGNTVVANLLSVITSGVDVFIDVTNSELTQDTIKTHRAILNAIISHDGVAARDAMSTHLYLNKYYFDTFYTSLNP